VIVCHLFEPLICTLLEYCCAVWSPHYHYSTDKIKGVKRFFTNTLGGLANEPNSIRLLLLNLEYLDYRCLTQNPVLCYKVHHRLVETELLNAQLRRVCTMTSLRGYSFRLHKVSCSTDASKYFTNQINDVWNKLPVLLLTLSLSLYLQNDCIVLICLLVCVFPAVPPFDFSWVAFLSMCFLHDVYIITILHYLLTRCWTMLVICSVFCLK
jgi:hypothetical protein